MTYVSVKKRSWDRQGHGGLSRETDYSVLLHGPGGPPVVLLRMSSHGNMTEGYWGSAARRAARRYAGNVARTLGQTTPVVIWSER